MFGRRRSQQGAATLAVALLTLLLMTLLTLFTANTAIMEQKISGNQYRAEQAIAAANAALDQAIAHFDRYKTNNEAWLGSASPVAITRTVVNCTTPSTTARTITLAGGTPITYPNGSTRNATWTLQRVTGDCTSPTGDVAAITVTATGVADDASARHRINVQLGGIDILGGRGPEQPLISRGSVGLTGNVTIINRYHSHNVWSGWGVALGPSNSAQTFIRPPTVTLASLSRDQKIDSSGSNTGNVANAVLASGRERGNNADIIENDPTLLNMTPDEFFQNFFAESAATVEEIANSNEKRFLASDSPNLNGLTGLIWVEGDYTLNGGTIGSVDDPAILIFENNLSTSGNPTIIGLLYVRGVWNTTGTTVIQGSAIVEGLNVTGAGGPTIVYDKELFDGSLNNESSGTTAVVAGTWRDWGLFP